MDETPTVIGKLIGLRTVEIRCPYCKKNHKHGCPLEGVGEKGVVRLLGHRLAHCDPNKVDKKLISQGYYIKVKE